MSSNRFKNWKKPNIKHGEPTQWQWVVYYPDKLHMGKLTDIGAYTAIFCQHGVHIGDEVQIGAHCTIYSESTISLDGKSITGKIVIGKGAQIGAHSTIMPGVTIGDGAVIGAYSLVKADVPPYTLVIGIPAKFVKKL